MSSGRARWRSVASIGWTVGTLLLWFLSPASQLHAEAGEITLDLYPGDDRSQGHPIRLTYEGEVFEDGLALRPADPPPPDGTPERFLHEFLKASRSGSIEEVLEYWHPEERSTTRARLAPHFERNQETHREFRESRLYSKLFYGSYVLMAVRHEFEDGSDLVSIYPLVESGESYALSNGLMEDAVFQILYFTFQDGVGLDPAFQTISR
jgi:hypothetical protein